jgi:hypothetical protein
MVKSVGANFRTSCTKADGEVTGTTFVTGDDKYNLSGSEGSQAMPDRPSGKCCREVKSWEVTMQHIFVVVINCTF